MKFHNQGAFFRVTASESEVEQFAEQFPCSGFSYGDRVSFTFDSRNGDLVDLVITHAFAGVVERDGAGIVALADDARQYGLNRLAHAQMRFA